LLLSLTGGYSAGWVLCAIPGLWVGVSLLRPRVAVERRATMNQETEHAAGRP
jgi:hypothetical protein